MHFPGLRLVEYFVSYSHQQNKISSATFLYNENTRLRLITVAVKIKQRTFTF